MPDFAKETDPGRAMPLAISNLTVSLGVGESRIAVVEDVSMQVRPGEILGLVGESGSGKSVTCLAALGLLGSGWQTDGEIRLARTRIAGSMSEKALSSVRGLEAAMVFQDASASLNPIQRIGKQLTETVARLRKVGRGEAREIALDLLRRVEMPDPEERFYSYPFQLSGGQNQRVMIAVALAGRPELLFADEPTTALDVTVQSQILELIKSLRDETKMGVVFVSHDLGVVKEVCDSVAVMYAGRIVEAGSVDRVMNSPRHPYTMGLIESMPTLSGHIPDGIEGQVPSPLNRPPGCAFAPRCGRARERCRKELPIGSSDEKLSKDYVACFFPLTGDLTRAVNSEPVVRSKVANAGGEDALLELKGAACDYGTRRGLFRAISGVTLSMQKGGSLAVIGESGSGKSTIGKLMLGIEPTSEGTARFNGRPVPILGTKDHIEFTRSVQLVPQNPYLSLDPRAAIGSQIEEPLEIHGIGTRQERRTRKFELLEAVGLHPSLSDRYPHEVSGGQCQRVVIARALALRPQVLICDEATASLDVSVQARIIELLRDLHGSHNLSIVFITHDLRLARSLCDRVAVMRSGQLVELGETTATFEDPQHPYTRQLLASMPDVEAEHDQSREIAQ
ncbi:MAG: ABC transporter ATP-binding protein [Albidovulum sp.]|nr:ABC transporter ATP-binding protein [Albidovulum sp.]